MVRTPLFQGGNTGSTPVGGAKMPREKEENKIQNDEINEPAPLQKKEISWRAAEFSYFKKGFFWYLIIVGVGLFLVIISLIKNNFLFAVFIFLAEVIIVSLANRRPRILDFIIDEEGVKIGKDLFYPYENIDSFCIYEKPNQLWELIFKRKVTFDPYLKLPIDSKSAEEVKKFLSGRLKEFEYNPSWVDILSYWLGI